ncbi:condensation domain-containing protein, partial [Nonomuraea basaltis]|uniref:condensation domain-containing protein n=1 Tax=Nonomuraea basaltis TaxID=2495887 RepID=UPI001F0DEDD6
MTGTTAARTRAPSAALFEVRGELDGGLLQEAVRVVAGRHDILRGAAGAGAAWVSVPLVDVSGLGPGEQDREIGRLVAREAAQISALATPPPVRVSLVRRGPGLHVVAVVAHQLVMDRPSIGLFARELARAYAGDQAVTAGDAAGPASESARVPGADERGAAGGGSYADFAAWQRERLSTRAAARALDHWRHALSGLPDLSLPTDRIRAQGRGRSLPMGSHRWQVSSALGARLRAVAVSAVDDVLLAAWLAVLSRYGGQRDIAVGLAVPGRPDGWAGALGPFENTVVLRADLTGDPTFAGLVSQVERARRQAEEHGATPFEQLVDELRPLPCLVYASASSIV